MDHTKKPGLTAGKLSLVVRVPAPWWVGSEACMEICYAHEGYGRADVQKQGQKNQKAGSQEGEAPGEESERMGKKLLGLRYAYARDPARARERTVGGVATRSAAEGSWLGGAWKEESNEG